MPAGQEVLSQADPDQEARSLSAGTLFLAPEARHGRDSDEHRHRGKSGHGDEQARWGRGKNGGKT